VTQALARPLPPGIPAPTARAGAFQPPRSAQKTTTGGGAFPVGGERRSAIHGRRSSQRCPHNPSLRPPPLLARGGRHHRAALTRALADGTASGPAHQQQIGKPAEDDLASWGHFEGVAGVPDDALQHAGSEGRVSFVFCCKIDGREVPPEAPISAAQSAAQCAGTAAPRSTAGVRPQRVALAPSLVQQLVRACTWHAAALGAHPSGTAAHFHCRIACLSRAVAAAAGRSVDTAAAAAAVRHRS